MDFTTSIREIENSFFKTDHMKEVLNSNYVSRERSVAYENSIAEEVLTDSSFYIQSDDESVSLSSNQSSSSKFSCSKMSDSDVSDSSRVLSDAMKFDRKNLTLAWVKKMSCETIDFVASDGELSTSDELVMDTQNSQVPSICQDNSPLSPADSDLNIDDSIFVDDISSETCKNLIIDFSNALTEDSLDGSFSFSKGSLKNLDDHEFSDDDDLEIMFTQCSISSTRFSEWDDIVNEGSELSQGFVNEAFEDYLCQPLRSPALQRVNDKWNDSMENIDDGPRTPIKVSFASHLVTVHNFEKEVEDTLPHDSEILDQLRFQRRINYLESILSPFLSSNHREKIILRNTYI